MNSLTVRSIIAANFTIRGNYENIVSPAGLAPSRCFPCARGIGLHTCTRAVDEGTSRGCASRAWWEAESGCAGAAIAGWPDGPVGNLGSRGCVQPESCERSQGCSLSALGEDTGG